MMYIYIYIYILTSYYRYISFYVLQIDPNKPDHKGIIPLTVAAVYGHYECFEILLRYKKSFPILAKHPTLLHVIVESSLSSKANIDSSCYIMQLLFNKRREFFDKMMSSRTHPTVVEMVIWYGRVRVSLHRTRFEYLWYLMPLPFILKYTLQWMVSIATYITMTQMCNFCMPNIPDMKLHLMLEA